MQNRKFHSRAESIISKYLDFWLLGGASILLWATMLLGQAFRSNSAPIEQHFLQMGATFGALALICNHPHFIVSYKLAYSRGKKFIFRHWLPLLFVPAMLTTLYTSAYFFFFRNISEYPLVIRTNNILSFFGISFQLGKLPNFGIEAVSLSVWIMYLTVGWHYSKQVFGCVMVYAHYDQYSLTKLQRRLIKASVFSVAFFNFSYINAYLGDYSSSLNKMYFFNIPLTPLGIPQYFFWLSAILVAVSFCAVLVGVFFLNYKNQKKLPSINMLVPWVAFYVWWVPVMKQQEFYFLAVPFFHSLQYLPFAYKMELPNVTKDQYFYPRLSLRIILLLLISFMAFEFLPNALDQILSTSREKSAWFFTIAAIVFINIHHFFIDSVIWRFSQAEMRSHLLISE